MTGVRRKCQICRTRLARARSPWCLRCTDELRHDDESPLALLPSSGAWVSHHGVRRWIAHQAAG